MKCILVTLGWTGLFILAVYKIPLNVAQFCDPLIAFIVYPFAHILIGRLSVLLGRLLMQGFVSVFDLNRDMADWDKTESIWIGTLWPITAPIIFTVGIIGCILGLFYKVTFR